MTRLALLMVAVVAVAGLGCSKPTEEDCRKALANMQRLMGTDNLQEDGRIESEVRRCKGGSRKQAVECAIKAQTLDDLRHCEFFKVPENAPGVGPAGSAAEGSGAAVPPTGSAAPTPPAGSAAPTSPAGSGAEVPPSGPDGAGSAAGSAAGAAGAGSATGSAT